MKVKNPLLIIAIVVIVLLILSGVFGGNYFYNAFKDEIKQAKEDNNIILIESQKREDSLTSIIEYQINYSDNLRQETIELQSRNNNLYYELKKRNKKVFVIDTSFLNNARRIANSTNRFYKENDSIRP